MQRIFGQQRVGLAEILIRPGGFMERLIANKSPGVERPGSSVQL